MARESAAPAKKLTSSQQSSFLITTVEVIFLVIATWIGSITLAVLIEMVGLATKQPLATPQTVMQTVNDEWQQLQVVGEQSAVIKPLVDKTNQVILFLSERTQQWLHKTDQATSASLLNGLFPLKHHKTTALNRTLDKTIQAANQFLAAGVWILIRSCIRTILFITVLPLFALVTIVSLVDGLVQRTLRRLRGERESALIYHHAKRLALPIILTGLLATLLWPFSIDIMVLVLPFLLVFALSIWLTAKSFKKYL